jgi:2-dehydropantoate 2-reductase
VTVAPQETPIVCMQNGVENERRVLRRFPRTYAMCVMCPAPTSDPG